MTLRIKTNGHGGEKMKKAAIIYTNDPANSKIEVTLTGDVLPFAEIVPKTVRLIGQAGQPLQTEVRITPSPGNPFDIIGVKAEDGRYMRFQLEKRTDAGIQTFVIRVDNAKPEKGRFFDRLILTTTSPASPELQIRVFGIISEDTLKGGI